MYDIPSSDMAGESQASLRERYEVLKPMNLKGCHSVAEDQAQRSEAIRRLVHSSLDHSDPVHLKRTADNIANRVHTQSSEELQCVVNSLLAKVMDDKLFPLGWSKCSRYAATYADITYQLNLLMEIPEGKSKTRFNKILIRSVQQLFDATLKNVKLEQCKEQDVCGLQSLSSFCGHLYVEGLLQEQDIIMLVQSLLGKEQPARQLIQCTCELLLVIGKCMDSSNEGCVWMDKFCARLCNLAGSRSPCHQDSALKAEPMYDQEIRNLVGEVLQAREEAWPARPEEQILLKLDEVSMSEALRTKADLGLQEPAQGNDFHRRVAADLEAGLIRPLKVSMYTDGRHCAVLFIKDPDNFGKEIQKQTGIHQRRLMLFLPDGSIHKC